MESMEALAGQGPGAPECFFDKLPSHILAGILGRDASRGLRRLCRLSTVCKTFHSAIQEVEEVSFDLEDDRLKEMRLLRFLQKGRGLRLLRLSAPSTLSLYPNAFLMAALGLVKSLRKLELHRGSLRYPPASEESADDFFKTLSLCPALEHLSLRLCEVPVISSHVQLRSVRCLQIVLSSAPDDSIASLIKLCPSLVSLHLIRIIGLNRLRIKSSSLVSLTFEACGDSMRSLLDRVEIDAPQLRKLSMQGSVEATFNTPKLEKLVASGSFNHLVLRQPWSLKELHIRGSPWMKDELLNLLKAAKGVAVVKLCLFVWEGDTPSLSPKELLSPIEAVQQLTIGELLTQTLSKTLAAVPRLSRLEELDISLSKADEEFPLCLQLAAASPKLTSFTIQISQGFGGAGGLSRRQVADCFKYQRQHPDVKFNLDF